MSETITHEFWLVATVQDCKLDAQKEVAHAKFFSKWHFQDAEFPKRVREGRRKLVGEGDQDAASLAEKLEKGTMLKGKMLDESAADAADDAADATDHAGMMDACGLIGHQQTWNGLIDAMETYLNRVFP